MEQATLLNIANTYGTPSYVFDTDLFARRAAHVKACLGPDVGLCYSIKANPFLTASLPEQVQWIEVCSPGELTVCEKIGADMKTVIFSGVNKTEQDIERAMTDGVGMFTAESIFHAEAIQACAAAHNKQNVPVILRLSNGNQFGMDESDLRYLIKNRGSYGNLEILGLHYYTGTQKKKAAVIAQELQELDTLCRQLEEEYGFSTAHVEYGPGLAVDYFGEQPEQTDLALLAEAGAYLRAFGAKYHLTVEMGRFLAAPCGFYLTKMMDTKITHGISYAICDGGIHQVKYYGQTMAMQVPDITVLEPVSQNTVSWSLCGSLCTTADVLVRKAELTGAEKGSVLAFSGTGAYSVCEGIALFLSREMPCVVLYSEQKGPQLVRDFIRTDRFNVPIR